MRSPLPLTKPQILTVVQSPGSHRVWGSSGCRKRLTEVGDPLVVPPQALGSAVSMLPWALSTAARLPALKIPQNHCKGTEAPGGSWGPHRGLDAGAWQL